MPIFEYQCEGCEHTFEALVNVNSSQEPTCPQCHGKQLHKLISTFGAVHSFGGDLESPCYGQGGRGPCQHSGGCGCGLN